MTTRVDTTQRRRTPRAVAPPTFTHRLDREWQHLRRRRRIVTAAKHWRPLTAHTTLAEILVALTDLQELVDATQAGEPGADGILLELIRLAQADQLAGRVLVQRLLPALIARAARYRSHHDAVDPAELAVPAAWMAIRRYDVERRRSHVAACLVSDATDRAFRQPLRRRAATEHPAPPAAFVSRPADPHGSPVEELARVVRAAGAAGVPDDDLDLVRELARTGSSSIVARDVGVTARTIRNRRDRAVARIRTALLAA